MTVLCLLGTLALSADHSLLRAVEDAKPRGQGYTKYEGRTIEEWIARWSEGSFNERQEATKAIVRIGKPAVPALVALIEKGDPHSGQAYGALGEMGPAAREALPVMLRVARDRSWPTPEGWTWNVSPRELVFSGLGKMSWASKELVPALGAIAGDQTEPEAIRTRAASALKGMGKGAIPTLERLTRSPSAAVSARAHHALVAVTGQAPAEYFALVLEANPCDPNAPEFLGYTKGIINAGRLHALTEKVKTAQREQLKAHPDAQLAFTLATIIQNQLANTSLQWAVPVDGIGSRWDRESPKEGFHTLAEVLRVGFDTAAADSEFRPAFGKALVKLRLLQGDWDGMNAMLEELGQAPIPHEDRPWLPAPPADWSGELRSEWKPCDPSMRSGSCSFVVRLEKDGKGLQGVHVLMQEAPKPTNVSFTGISVDTLFFSPYPMGKYSFGYRASGRSKTRYAVSDSTGVVRFDKLPETEVKFEILVPTSNFPEAGPAWEFWMETSPRKFQLASMEPKEGAIRPSAPEAQVKLEAGKTVDYPLLVVRPRFTLNVYDWARVDHRSFELTWPRLDGSSDAGPTTYELEMALSASSEQPDFSPPPVLRSAKETVTANAWPVGQRGVGGLRLAPGNIYTFQVTARDGRGEVLARSDVTRVWVPWAHRACDAPLTASSGDRDAAPITHGKWWRGSSSYGDGTKENLKQKLDRYLRERPRGFERECVEMGKAWLEWRDGDLPGARKQLEELVESVPRTSVAHATAASLLKILKEGGTCPKRLQFVAPDGGRTSRSGR